MSSPHGQAITRDEILARAQSWLNPQVPYNQRGYYPNATGYREDCSGYVSMAWELSRSYTTYTLGEVAQPISKDDLLPGDALLNRDGGGNEAFAHVLIFAGWADDAHAHYNAYEESDYYGGAHYTTNIPYPYWSAYYRSEQDYVPVRLDGLASGGGGPSGPTMPPSLPAGTVTEFSLPTQNSRPNGIAAGRDGNLWVTQSGGGNVMGNPSGGCSCVGGISRVTPDGSVKVFADPKLYNSGDGMLQPQGIVVGPDGNLWFIMSDEFGPGYAGEITSSGDFTELPTFLTDSSIELNSAASIAVSPDGTLWITYQGDPPGIARISPSGDITPFPISADQYAQMGALTMGPDGNLWFSDSSGVGRITPDGTITGYPLDQSIAAPSGITLGPDGNLWFAEQNGIGRITPDGSITSYALPRANSAPDSITKGPDGNLWFTENYGIGRITPTGSITVFPVSSSFATTSQNQFVASSHEGITGGPNGNLWFIDPAANKVGEITP